MSTAALEISHLVKRYGDLVAVDDVTLRVEPGDFFGFLGPNGAGKTTTINAVVSLVKKTSGSISVFGHDVDHDWRAARALVGLAPQEYNFDRYLSLRDILIYQAGYFGLPPKAVRARADALIERFGLTSKINDEYMKLSGGMKRRLTLARALIHEPKLLILDEPTAGVDVELRLELWDFVRELNAAGTTIILTTHYLEEAEALCKNIAIIREGKIVACAPTKSLLNHEAEATLVIVVDEPLRALPDHPALAGALHTPGDATICLEGINPSQITSVLGALDGAGLRVSELEFKRSSLQDVFLELTRR